MATTHAALSPKPAAQETLLQVGKATQPPTLPQPSPVRTGPTPPGLQTPGSPVHQTVQMKANSGPSLQKPTPAEAQRTDLHDGTIQKLIRPSPAEIQASQARLRPPGDRWTDSGRAKSTSHSQPLQTSTTPLAAILKLHTANEVTATTLGACTTSITWRHKTRPLRPPHTVSS